MTRPVYDLKVNGRPLPIEPLEIEVIDNLGPMADSLRVTLPGVDGTGTVIAHPPHGRKITAAFGYTNTPLQVMGEFVVSGVDFHAPPVIMTITADTPELLGEMGAIKAPKTKSWHDISLPDLFSTIVQRYSLIPRLSERLRGIHIAHVDQVAESDLAFLTHIGRTHNAVFTIKEGNAVLLVRGDGKNIFGADLPRHDVDLDASDGITWDANYLDRPAYGSVVADWSDTNAGGGVQAVTVGDGEPVYQIRHPYASEGEARFAAEAELDEFRREVAELSISMPGRPAIRAGQLLNVTTRYPVGGLWYIAEAQHTYAD